MFCSSFRDFPMTIAAEPELPPVVLQMLRNDKIFEQLGLSSAQRVQVEAVLDRVDGDWWRSRIMQDPQRNATVHSLTLLVKTELQGILSPESYERLLQLERQSLGTRMFLLDSVATALGLSPVTVERMATIAKKTDSDANELRKRAETGEATSSLEAKLQELSKREQAGIVAMLTNSQRPKINELTGEPFAFGQLQRTLPRAPELIQTPSLWIQGQPTSLAALRGKVVAVHVYAFQCINCQRNLPHYTAWHNDYADKGLVVIGIQSPETSGEREPSKILAAAKQEGIKYLILFDPDSTNWQAWGTTMWPTVYLIDRQGYIRTWWQGEMNWQGNPGEQKMRGHIESLLKEPS